MFCATPPASSHFMPAFRSSPSDFDLCPFAYTPIQMAAYDTCLPFEPESVRKAHAIISPFIYRTPLLTSHTLDKLCSSSLDGKPTPRLRLHFKCENYQKIGAFKARGAFHALTHLIKVHGEDEVRRRGVTTHSSGSSWQKIIRRPPC